MYSFKALILLSFISTICQAQVSRPHLGMFNQEDKPELDLFAQEGFVDLGSLELDFVNTIGSHGIDKLNSNLNTAAGILNNFGHSFYSVAEDSSMQKFFSPNRDSVLALLETSGAGDIDKFTDPLYLDSLEVIKTFFDLSKRIQGNLQKYELVDQELLFLEKPKRYYGLLTYKTVFAKASGFLELYFRLSNEKRFGLAKMVFTPYDNQQNIFLKAIAANDVELLSKKDFKSLEARFTPSFTQRIEKRKERFENELDKLIISENLFSYRSFIRNGLVYAVTVFSTNKENKLISIRYILEDRRFLIDQISAIDKNP